MSLNHVSFSTLTTAWLFIASAAYAADPAVTCESGKLKEAGKYASCLLSADSKAVKTNTSPDYSKCISKFSYKWQSTEAKGEGMCPGGAGDQSSIQSFLDACDQAVAGVLAGDTPAGLFTCTDELGSCSSDLASCLSACPVVAYVRTGQTTCYDSSGAVIACAGTGQDGELQKGVARSFTDNGDGTVTDNATKLMWEKLSDDGSIHDKDNPYTWANAFAVKVATLNSTDFAGHNDWRVPNLNELETLRNIGALNPATYSTFNSGCVAACTVSTCSCTQSYYYWSSSAYQDLPSGAWYVLFAAGDTAASNKTYDFYVRAVRTGS